jgi:acetyl esterase
MSLGKRAAARAQAAIGRVEAAAARTLLLLPDRLKSRLAGGGPIVVDGQTLAPELQLLLTARRWLGMPGLSDEPPAQARITMRRDCSTFAGPLAPVARNRDLVLDGPAGPLRARHYAPRAGAGRPLIVFFHGGGFVAGDIESHDAPCRLLCHEARAHVLSVDYRLAPEHKFPAAVDDTLAGWRWAVAHAGTLGADPTRIAVAGDSAGGNLAAVVAIEATRLGIPPALQLLLYPVVDRAGPHPSRALFSDGFLLTQKDIDWYDMHSLGGTTIDRHDPRISPIYAQDVSKLPPALIATAAFDPLRDEGEAYGARLHAAGVPMRLRRCEGLIHGFISLIGVSPLCRAATVNLAREAGAMLDAAPRAAVAS